MRKYVAAGVASLITAWSRGGHHDLLGAFALVDLLERGGPEGPDAYNGPGHFDYKPLGTEAADAVLEFAVANTRTSCADLLSDPRGFEDFE